MAHLKIDNLDFFVPGCWEDLSASQIKTICKLSCRDLTPPEFKLIAFFLFTGIKPSRFPLVQTQHYASENRMHRLVYKKTKMFLSAADLALAISPLDFLFEVSDQTHFLSSKIYTNHFKELRTPLKKLYGPDSALFNLRFDEFIRMETLYHLYMQDTSQKKVLNKMLACLYRPKDKDAKLKSKDFSGDIRLPFNDHLIDHYAGYTKYLNSWKKAYVLIFYQGCRYFITQKYPNAFSGNSDSEQSDGSAFENFMMLVTMLSNKDMTKAKHIRQSPLFDALPQMESLAIETKKINEMSDKKPKY